MVRERLSQTYETVQHISPAPNLPQKDPFDVKKLLTNPVIPIDTKPQRNARKKDIRSFQIDARSHKIVSEEIATNQDSLEAENSVLFTLTSTEQVLFTPPRKKIPLQDPQPLSHSLMQDLDTRQIKQRTKDQRARIHEKNQLFFMANWPRLASYLFESWPLNAQSTDRYREVFLNNFGVDMGGEIGTITLGAIDFCGIGPDGQMVIIEFDPVGRGKSVQLAKQARGLEAIVTSHNQTTTINQLKGIYNLEDNLMKISFEEPAFAKSEFLSRDYSRTVFQAVAD